MLATTLRLTGDFDLSEEAVQDAFVAALEQWPAMERPPTRTPGWCRRRAISVVDQLRRRARFEDSQAEIERIATLEDFGSICPRLPWWTTNCV